MNAPTYGEHNERPFEYTGTNYFPLCPATYIAEPYLERGYKIGSLQRPLRVEVDLRKRRTKEAQSWPNSQQGKLTLQQASWRHRNSTTSSGKQRFLAWLFWFSSSLTAYTTSRSPSPSNLLQHACIPTACFSHVGSLHTPTPRRM